eukprot:6191593-Pleurochrysis_carterae.AAC.1
MKMQRKSAGTEKQPRRPKAATAPMRCKLAGGQHYGDLGLILKKPSEDCNPKTMTNICIIDNSTGFTLSIPFCVADNRQIRRRTARYE